MGLLWEVIKIVCVIVVAGFMIYIYCGDNNDNNDFYPQT